MKCFICKEEINPQNGRHIYHCSKKNNINLSKDEIKYKQICYESGVKFTKDLMVYHYEDLGWSLPDFKKKYSLGYKQTQFLLSYFDIVKRGIAKANASGKRSQKYRNTCRKKYGVENISQLDYIKEKKKKTFIEHYGVDNIWKCKDYYQWLHTYMVEEYGKKSLPNRFGNMQKYWDGRTKKEKQEHMKPANNAFIEYWGGLTDEQKNIIIQKRCRHLQGSPVFTSKLETRLCGILNSLCLRYTYQFWINRRSYDFRINNTKLLIEVQGDYWHANPYRYKKDDLIHYPDGWKKASEIWDRDRKKQKNAEKYSYKIIYIWEKQIKDSNDKELSLSVESAINKAIIPNTMREKDDKIT